MPNWCHNTLTVTGQQADVDAFVEAAKVQPKAAEADYERTMFLGTEEKPDLAEWIQKRIANQPLSFESFAPIPEAEAAGEGWYDWSIRNWGTKWDANFSGMVMAIGDATMDVGASTDMRGLTLEPGKAVYKFDTAWSPPVPVVHEMSKQHPSVELTLRFAEVGHGQAGELTFISGLLAHEHELKVEDVLAPAEMWF